jgi:hypothetical protein
MANANATGPGGGLAQAPTTVDPSNGDASDLSYLGSQNLADSSIEVQMGPAGSWGYQNLTASGTTVVKTGAGQLKGFFCGIATGNITIYDNTAASGAKILDTCALVVGLNLFYCGFNTGLTIVLSGAGVATAFYR